MTRPAEELSLVQRGLAFWTRLALHCAGELKRDRAPQVAAALTYHTLFSLIPMLLLVLLVFHSFQLLEGYSDRFETMVIDLLLPESIDDQAEAIALPSAEGPELEFHEARLVMRERFSEGLQRVRDLNLTGIGVVGLVVFLYGALSLLGTVERSFDSIYRAETRRPARTRLPIYFTIMILGPIALVAGQVLQERLLERMASVALTAWLAAPLATLLPLLATWLVVFASFWTLPNTYVKKGSAAVGSLISAFLWLLLQELFGLYANATILSSLYGALALFPILLAWMYLSWLVVLFGLELSYSLQHHGNQLLPLEKQALPVPGDPRWLLPIVTRIAAGFRDGRPTSRRDLVQETGLPFVVLQPFLAVLENDGLIFAVKQKGDEPAYTLAMPPAQIALDRVFGLSRSPSYTPGPAWQYLERQRSREDDEAAGRSLESMFDLGPPVAESK